MGEIIIVMCRHGDSEPSGGITGGGLDVHLIEKGKEQAKKLGHDLKNLYGDNLAKTIIHSGMHRANETAVLAALSAFEGMTIRQVKVDKKGQPVFDNDLKRINEEVLLAGCSALDEIHHGSTEGMPGAERKKMWEAFIQAWQEEHPNEIRLPNFPFSIHPRRGSEVWGKEHPHETMPPEFAYQIHPRPENGAETWNEVWERANPALINLVNEVIKDYSEEDSDKSIVIAVVVHNAVMQRFAAEWLIKKNQYSMENGFYKLHWQNDLIGNGSFYEFRYHRNTNDFELLSNAK